MSKNKIVGVKRQTKYSPNHIGNDAMIFNLTAEHLIQLGYELEEYTESEFMLADFEDQTYFFNMVRGCNEKITTLRDEWSNCSQLRLRYRKLYPCFNDKHSIRK